MKKIILFILAVILIAVAVGYLTHLNRSTGVPFYRHNETYRILQSDTLSQQENVEKNYTQPFKKYSLIDDEGELILNNTDTFEREPQDQNNSDGLTPKKLLD